jgi:hypothetical protein
MIDHLPKLMVDWWWSRYVVREEECGDLGEGELDGSYAYKLIYTDKIITAQGQTEFKQPAHAWHRVQRMPFNHYIASRLHRFMWAHFYVASFSRVCAYVWRSPQPASVFTKEDCENVDGGYV